MTAITASAINPFGFRRVKLWHRFQLMKPDPGCRKLD